MITSRLSSDGQTNVPQSVRAALDLRPGDDLSWRIEGDHVILGKAALPSGHDPFASFEEWDRVADRQAYATL